MIASCRTSSGYTLMYTKGQGTKLILKHDIILDLYTMWVAILCLLGVE